MPFRPPKKANGRPRKETIGPISEMVFNIKGIYESEIQKLKEKVISNKTLTPQEHKILEACTKNIMLLAKEERQMRDEEDFANMEPRQLKKLAEAAMKTLKKDIPKEREMTDESEETSDDTSLIPFDEVS